MKVSVAVLADEAAAAVTAPVPEIVSVAVLADAAGGSNCRRCR